MAKFNPKIKSCDETSLPDFLKDILDEEDDDCISIETLEANEMLDKEDFINRRIYIRDEIKEKTTYDVIRMVMRCNVIDEPIPVEYRNPIRVYINTVGGDVISSMIIYELFKKSKTPIYTYNIGICFSGGFMIYLGGHKRFAMQNSYFMYHDGTTAISNTTMKVVDARHFNDDIQEKSRNLVLESTNITPEEYDSKLRTDWYLTAEESVENGIVHEIVDDLTTLIGHMVASLDVCEVQDDTEEKS